MHFPGIFSSRERAAGAVIDKSLAKDDQKPIVATWYEPVADQPHLVQLGVVAQLDNGWHDLHVGTINFEDHAFTAQDGCPFTVQAGHDTPFRRALRRTAADMSGALGWEAFNLLGRDSIIGAYTEMLDSGCKNALQASTR